MRCYRSLIPVAVVALAASGQGIRKNYAEMIATEKPVCRRVLVESICNSTEPDLDVVWCFKMARMLFLILASLSNVFCAGWELVGSGVTSSLNGISFVDQRKGFIVGGGGVVLVTHDTGKTWAPIHVESGVGFHGVSFSDASHGVIGGTSGRIYRTHDGGSTWTRAVVPDTGSLNIIDIKMVTPATGIAVGSKPALRIWETNDSGKSWVAQDSSWFRTDMPSSNMTLSATRTEILFPTPDTGYIILAGSLRSVDGGKSWVVVVPRSDNATTGYSGGHFFDGRRGLLAGQYYGAISYTQSAGDTNVMRTSFKAEDVHFPSSMIGYAVSGNPLTGIQRSSDGGMTWTAQPVPVAGWLMRVHFINPNIGFAVGANGTILRTTDGGGSPVNVVPQQRGTSPVRPPFKGSLGRFFDALGRNVRNMQFFARSMDVGG
jgi:photosystem II stability/assembly factor-like uncharacterized protein